MQPCPWYTIPPHDNNMKRGSLRLATWIYIDRFSVQPRWIRSFAAIAASPGTPAKLMDGKSLAKRIRTDLKADIAAGKLKNPRFKPNLVIIHVGTRPDSTAYIKMKLGAACDTGIACSVKRFPETASEAEVIHEVQRLNADPSVNGILVQMPLPYHMSEHNVTDSIDPTKDVDGFGALNIGLFTRRHGKPQFVPCTPLGILALLDEYEVKLQGKHAVVIGRSDIVGSPTASLLKNRNASVTLCHRYTENLEELVRMADILVIAAGHSELVKGHWIKPGAVVVDVGMNYVPDPTKKSGQRLTGDAEFVSVSQKASLISPVPGGVGPMTVTMLLRNVYRAAVDQTEGRYKVHNLPLDIKTPIPCDLDISRSHHPRSIVDLATSMGLSKRDIKMYGNYKAKIKIRDFSHHQNKLGKYIVVCGMTPTALGEGKSTTTLGLSQALNLIDTPSIACVRQPSMGPLFGAKGGAAGGGYSQIIPMEEFNLHLTGDIHAITEANNLAAAAVDTRHFHESRQSDKAFWRRMSTPTLHPSSIKWMEKKYGGKIDPDNLGSFSVEALANLCRLDIDPSTITIKRAIDTNDRMLRQIEVGLSPKEHGYSRSTGFTISAASECMAIVALSSSFQDMRKRLGNMIVAQTKSGNPRFITNEDIGVAGAMSAILVNAIHPNLMQTIEGTPVLVHAGPFANISIGSSSIVADRLALDLMGPHGYTITEAGFDFTMGGERFLDIKCRSSGITPDAIVIVATTRCLKMHGGGSNVASTHGLPLEYISEDIGLLERGFPNLAHQIKAAKEFGVPVVVAINKFHTDTNKELDLLKQLCLDAGAAEVEVSDHFARGGAGAIDLARSVQRAAESSNKSDFKFLYDNNKPIMEKLETIACKMYGAKGIELSSQAKAKIDLFESQGKGDLPICFAKTQYSLSHDPSWKGAPRDYILPVKDLWIYSGAGYICALASEMTTMPGLPTRAEYLDVDIAGDGRVSGLS